MKPWGFILLGFLVFPEGGCRHQGKGSQAPPLVLKGILRPVGPSLPHQDLQVAPLPDGRALVLSQSLQAGTRNYGATAELFDLRSGAFFPLPLLNPSRICCELSSLGDGSLLVSGGIDGGHSLPGDLAVMHQLERFDSARGSFEALPGKLLHPRVQHRALPLGDGNTLILGGRNRNGRPEFRAELYVPRLGRCQEAGKLCWPRVVGYIAIKLLDGRVLLAGGKMAGSRAEVYDPMTRTFQTVGSLGRERVGASAFLLQDGRVLISGGTDEDSDHFSNSAELFLPHENRFIPVAASMGTERQGAAMAQLPDGKVLVAGGINAEGPVRSLEYFDPDSRTFRPGPRSNLRGTQVHVTVLEGHPVLFWSEEPWAEVME